MRFLRLSFQLVSHFRGWQLSHSEISKVWFFWCFGNTAWADTEPKQLKTGNVICIFLQDKGLITERFWFCLFLQSWCRQRCTTCEHWRSCYTSTSESWRRTFRWNQASWNVCSLVWKVYWSSTRISSLVLKSDGKKTSSLQVTGTT